MMAAALLLLILAHLCWQVRRASAVSLVLLFRVLQLPVLVILARLCWQIRRAGGGLGLCL